jgi:hypothetical protein
MAAAPAAEAVARNARRDRDAVLMGRRITSLSLIELTFILLCAGLQYALGDLKADDAPSVKGGTK